MQKSIISMRVALVALCVVSNMSFAAAPAPQAAKAKQLNVLFIGNSFTACTFYAALFNRSPEGLPINKIDDRPTKDGKPALDPDGKPILTVFSDKDRADLQRIAWEGLQLFQKATAAGGQR